MKSFKNKKTLFLLLGLAAITIGFGYYFTTKKTNSKNQFSRYHSFLQENIFETLNKSDSEIQQVSKLINSSKNNTFEQIKIETRFPFFIFKNKNLIYWSDNKYVPKHDQIVGKGSVFFENYFQNLGIFNVKKQYMQQDTIEIVSIINLYQFFRNQNDYLQSGYNSSIFYIDPKKISSESFSSSTAIVDNSGNKIFFFQEPEIDKSINSNLSRTNLWIIIVTFALISLYAFKRFKVYLRVHKFGKALLLLFANLIAIRLILIVTGFPWIFLNQDIFNPSFYKGSFWAPTLGDLILNGFFIIVFISFLALYYFRTQLFNLLGQTKPIFKSIVAVILVLFVMGLAYFCSLKIEDIYENSVYNLGYAMNIGFTKFNYLSFVYYFFVLNGFFISSHIATNIFLTVLPKKKSGFFHWLYGFLSGIIIYFFIDGFKMAFVISGLYFLIVYIFRLPRYFYTLRFKTLIYFIISAFCFALISVKTVEVQEGKKGIIDKTNFGKRYLVENDLLGEGLLYRLREQVKNNEALIASFKKKEFTYESIKQKVKDDLLDIYFDKYEIEVKVFDNTGRPIGGEETAYINQLISEYNLENHKTDFPFIFFINETEDRLIKQYITFNEVFEENKKIGTIVLDLKLKDENETNEYPELLLDKKFVQNPESKNYSYGIFDNTNHLIYNAGSFNYLLNFPTDLLSETAIYQKELISFGSSHFAIKEPNGKTIVVSEQNNYWKKLISNFSFLFLISILGVAILLLVFSILNGFKSFSINFSTRIQFYLNAAFLLPLIILIILTFTVVNTTLISIQEKSFLDNTKNISNSLQFHLENYLAGKSSQAFFENEVNELARITKVDINLYDVSGQLKFTTRPLAYQYNLLSNYLNPIAYSNIIEQRANEILTNESLGELTYKTAYMAIKGKENKNYGVLGIPFFDAKTKLDIQVNEVVATILIIFLLMFLLLFLSSYFASSQLTSPLKLIAQRIKKTNLDMLNETLDWKSNDEIGLLTKSYNKMIKKLEDSKIALSQSEKQNAWREMAKQVAHEIKNPLTPMKLSIQQLQRTLLLDDPKSRDRIQRALNSLTEQIDNISEIANSFSEFAKMPVPRNERFDLVPAVQKTVDLYSQNKKIKITFECNEKEIFVMGDRMLTGQIVNNLIINGLQSIPPIRQSEIKVKLYKNPEENFGRIEVKDNGVGIREEIRKKVFIPNFSTKESGSGLGLAMAKRGIEHSGGNIWFETVENEGTTFFVDLPSN